MTWKGNNMQKEANNWRQEFENPGVEYRGMPFWAWNCKVSREDIDYILPKMKEMGMGGAYLHCRTGMDLPYLGAEFMEVIRYAHEKATALGLRTGLYDEDRWPSGFAGGLITKEEKNRARFLVFSPEPLPEQEDMEGVGAKGNSSAAAVSSGNRKFLAAYQVRLENGLLADYRRCDAATLEGYDNWYAYLETYGSNPWYNNQAYVNTLDPGAIRDFIDTTYEAYYRELGEDFGKDIPTFFTDEPQFCAKTRLRFASDRERQVISFTDDLDETYREVYGESILDFLPELFWELPDGKRSVHRYRYHDHVAERFVNAYADQIGAWCRDHHIALTGHMMQEPSLEGQTMVLGEAMRSYRSFAVPGIDMLCDRRELTTAKQTQSAVHQFDCKDMMSELYGVTNWDFDFRGHKLAGDWQAALGVTHRVHHLFWTSMAGEAKRDYPASIGCQSPWYQEYRQIEDYFARINAALHHGKPLVKVGVIHPIESYWLFWGDEEHTGEIRREMENKFEELVQILLYGLIDFDFISESLLADWQQEGEEGFTAGAMRYDAVLVPDCVTLRETTVKRLSEFAERGGKVIFAGGVAEYMAGLPSGEPAAVAQSGRVIPFSRTAILSELEPERVLSVRDQDGKMAQNLLYQMREEKCNGGLENGGETLRWLFIAHSEKPQNMDLAGKKVLKIEVKGRWQVEKLIPQTGEVCIATARYENGHTCWPEVSYDYDSFLYRLTAMQEERAESCRVCRRKEDGSTVGTAEWTESGIRLPELAEMVLEEPNVLLLDQAEYSFDGGPWQAKEEILRIDNICRQNVGYPLRAEAYAQPWTEKPGEEEKHTLELKFSIESDWAAEGIQLALEGAEKTAVFWDGAAVSGDITGFYVDRSIRTIAMPPLTKGSHELLVKIPYTRKFQVEAMYLLGDFGVETAGRSARVTAPADALAFDDICGQKLPFYGGNIRYTMELEAETEEELALEISRFRCSLLKVRLDGRECGTIMIPPYGVSLGKVAKGKHTLEIEAFGNRFNTFGALHNCNSTELWAGPNYWRSTGTAWSYEYQLRKTGILKTPVIRKKM